MYQALGSTGRLPQLKGLCLLWSPRFLIKDDHDDYEDDDDDDGVPANYHQSYPHQVGICHDDEGWEYDTVRFPPYT